MIDIQGLSKRYGASTPSRTCRLRSSATVFAVLHPPPDSLPVYLLGLCTDFAYERSCTLAAPMRVHALNNGAVVGKQPILMPH